MKTVFDAKQWVYELLINGGIKSVINGGVYKDRRPSGSQKEDIVINSLTMTNDYLQDAVLNVNCYVPYLTVNIGGITQNQPNNARMRTIAAAVYPLLHYKWGQGFNLDVVNHTDYEEESENANYINFRINLKAFN